MQVVVVDYTLLSVISKAVTPVDDIGIQWQQLKFIIDSRSCLTESKNNITYLLTMFTLWSSDTYFESSLVSILTIDKFEKLYSKIGMYYFQIHPP